MYAQLFFCCLLVISSSIRKTFSRARVEERERSLFFLYFCCVLTAECLDGHGRMTSRRIQPSHTHGSSWWCLCLRHLFSMEEKKPAALEIDLFLFRLVVPVVDSVSIETMCSSSSSSSSPLSSSLSFLTLSGQPNESYRSTARPAGKI